MLSINVSNAQYVADKNIDQKILCGIDSLYNFNFVAADSIFDHVIKKIPNHPIGYFFKAMVQWERILSNYDDESQDEKLYDMLDQVIDMCDERLDKNSNDVTAIFFKGGAIGFSGRLRSNRGKWLAAINDGIAALPLVQKAYKLEPKNYDVLLGIGIYNYFAAVIPEKYPIAKPAMIFFPSGDKAKGLEQLKQASLYARYAKVEATYFLMHSYYLYEQDYQKALELAKQLNYKYPKNSLFHRYLGRCYVSVGMIKEAKEVFTEVLKSYYNKQVGYDSYDARESHYYIGKFDFNSGNYDTAFVSLLKCDEFCRKIDKDEASGFMVLSNLTMGYILDIQGKRNQAINQYKKILSFKEYDSSHSEAKKYLQQPYKK